MAKFVKMFLVVALLLSAFGLTNTSSADAGWLFGHHRCCYPCYSCCAPCYACYPPPCYAPCYYPCCYTGYYGYGYYGW